ncbi:phosphotransferase [Halobacillus sp. A1]|uniref:phosphotransferase enzyme family protein n=1 Tax=Halobacillus sp. A1 TaxID=2880262 RepID=UPI0020A62CA2|nr:phosphotransferase [Halobacillus sp. A1]MCP3030846.1 phosphotransferase [Halobacillus sp. A1]
MEQWIERLLTESVRRESMEHFELDQREPEKLGDFENYIYQVYRKGTPCILRITHSSHRTKEEIEAELEWVNFLCSAGIPAASALASARHRRVEEVKADGSSFFISLFEKAPGSPVKITDKSFDQELFFSWGKTVGKMHNVTKGFQPTRGRRKRWDEDDLLDFPLYLDSIEDSQVIEKGEKLKKRIQSLQESKERFGLIHSDLHHGNFFMDNGRVNVFDFDDSCYFYYVSDIAIPLYYAVWARGFQGSSSSFAEEFLTFFMKGYIEENELSKEILELIPLFLRFRDHTLYAVLHKKWGSRSLNESQQSLLAQIRERLLAEQPIVDVSYEKIWRKI